MIAIESTAKLEELLRNLLIEQSTLASERVLNSLSIHGEDLDKLLEDSIYVSLDRTDCVLLFELISRESSSDISNEDEDAISTYRSFSLKCILYGNDSNEIATEIVSRLRTEKVIEDLQAQGIYLETVSRIESVNEYKNETMWQRNDFDIDISCLFKISKISAEYELDSVEVDKIITI